MLSSTKTTKANPSSGGSGGSPEPPVLPFPDPLPGDLILVTKRRIGAYSDVHQGIWKYNDQEHTVCIKCLRNTTVPGDPGCTLTPAERFERRLKRETSIWVQSKHENVLPFLGYQISEGGEPRLVSPWMRNGSLDMYLVENPGISEIERLEFLRQATQGLAHLHGLIPPIAHGDLKPANIMINDTNTAVLCDMGISRVIIDGHTGLTTSGSAPGSVGFQAKELIIGVSLPTPKSDIYAMGGVILETMSGKKPFHTARTQGLVILSISTGKMCEPEDHPDLPADDPLWPCLRRCWSESPDQRPEAADILEELARAIDRRRPGPDSTALQITSCPAPIP